jgi:hypothetical protein
MPVPLVSCRVPSSRAVNLISIVSPLAQHYYFLKKDVNFLNISFKLKGGNPVWYFFQLFMGCVR